MSTESGAAGALVVEIEGATAIFGRMNTTGAVRYLTRELPIAQAVAWLAGYTSCVDSRG